MGYNAGMIFTAKDVAEQLSAERFSIGWQLFTEGRVTAPTIQRGGELITAIIPRPGNRLLRVYIRTSNEQGSLVINGECSCDVKQNCEHVAAVLLQALDDREALPGLSDIPFPRADAQLPSSFQSQSQPSPKNPQALLYFLQVKDDGVSVEMVVARGQQNGQYSAVRPFDVGRINRAAPARYLEPVDQELLAELDGLPRTVDTNFLTLTGQHSAKMLERLLLTERCFFGNAEGRTPLSIGASRPLDFQWDIDDMGNQRGEWQVTPEAGRVLPVTPFWYYDDENGECGPLDCELPMALVFEMVDLEPVVPGQIEKVNDALAKAWPDATVPLLQGVDIKTLAHSKPIPCLRLTTLDEQRWGDWIESYDMACLSFIYGKNAHNDGVRMAHNGASTCLSDGQLVQVQRDEKAEVEAVEQLRMLGFGALEEWGLEAGEDSFSLTSDCRDNDIETWMDFQVEDAPTLKTQGWQIEYEHFRHQVFEASDWTCNVEPLDQQDWFDIALGVTVDGQQVDLLPILLGIIRQYPRGLPDSEAMGGQFFVVSFNPNDSPDTREADDDDGNGNGNGNGEAGECLLRLPADHVLPLLEMLYEMYDGSVEEVENIQLSRFQLARLTALGQDDDGLHLQWLGDEDVQQLAQRLRELDGIPEVTPPKGLKASLRPYQQQGLDWLQFLREYQLAGILADDMGLGKTVQALAHVLLENEAGRADCPCLVIAPTSLMFNWRHEAERFAPQLKVLVLHGPERKQHFADIDNYDLIITTYPLLSRDKEALLARRYHLLILDEAQVIKNPKAQAAKVVREIDARHRLCLTGTPMENHLGELWSLFDFLLPGLLGTSKAFRRYFRTPIEKHGKEATALRLSQRIRPFLLRRTKGEVATELPDKTEITQSVVLEGKQRELYETVRLAMHKRVREEIQRQGVGRSHIVVLDALLKLRQVCCDPRLVKMNVEEADSKSAKALASSVKTSAKLEMLMDMLPEMVEEGRRILVFSQFTTMLGLIEQELNRADIHYVKLTGQTRDRETPVKEFQEGNVPVFLISLKAGGVGLNLTAADTVIHYDPWWNPAVERQATDRAHRIGQKQAVFVYKLICEGTLEEKIQAMQKRKQDLADGLYQSGESSEPQWNEQDLDALFGPLSGA